VIHLLAYPVHQCKFEPVKPLSTTLVNHVAAPVDRVFNLLTDPARMPQWLPGCSAAESAGPIRKGMKVKVHFGARESTFEVVDFQAPSTFGWVERGARQGCKTFFRLDFAGSLTAVTIKDVWQPPSLFALIRHKLRPRRFPALKMGSALQNLRLALSS
jgi:uncharacterized protein YndB with AHSA1/START domain